MKEVPKKDQPEVGGGDLHEGGCIPFPRLPGPDVGGGDYPHDPFAPVFESPATIEQ